MFHQLPTADNQPRDKAQRENRIGGSGFFVNGKELIWYPIQQNGGNGKFVITIGENGVVKESSITTAP